ncbi:MAG: radical SAM protein [Candidatus Eisenbacteria bacterium]|nr:radical SAM protein [Candidatus Eisenbacteria bacterium]MBU1951147.1 radical SAM protein [Candidatus Eisenbacteria bacterium]
MTNSAEYRTNVRMGSQESKISGRSETLLEATDFQQVSLPLPTNRQQTKRRSKKSPELLRASGLSRPTPGRHKEKTSGRSLDPIFETARACYRPLFSQTILNKCASPNLPFRYSINPYRGCGFGCPYCFARFTHELMDHHQVDDFHRKIYIKVDAGSVLRQDLKPNRLIGNPVAIGTATDPYQPAERRFGVTHRVLEILRGEPGLDLSVTTRSPLILRDLELLHDISRHRPLVINISLITLNAQLCHLVEPWAPRPRRRLDVIRQLSAAGLRVDLFVMPVLPGLTDSRDELLALLKAARKAGAMDAHLDLLRLRGPARRSFDPILRKHFPHLMPQYERFYGNNPDAPLPYRERIMTLFKALKIQAGYPSRDPRNTCNPLPGDQLELEFQLVTPSDSKASAL